jgi:hypothetical protein
MMKREVEVRSGLIDLGTATEATRGAWGIFSDEVLMHEKPGLASG